MPFLQQLFGAVTVAVAEELCSPWREFGQEDRLETTSKARMVCIIMNDIANTAIWNTTSLHVDWTGVTCHSKTGETSESGLKYSLNAIAH